MTDSHVTRRGCPRHASVWRGVCPDCQSDRMAAEAEQLAAAVAAARRWSCDHRTSGRLVRLPDGRLGAVLACDDCGAILPAPASVDPLPDPSTPALTAETPRTRPTA